MGGSREGRVRSHRFQCSTAVVFTFFSVVGGLGAPVHAQIKPIELDGFIVTGAPIPRALGTVASNVTVLDGEDLRLSGSAGAAEALAQVPGLAVVRNGSFGSVTSVFFRGAESDHVKVLLDGVELNQAGGSFDFAGLLVSDIERIEVVRGPASAYYGSDALAGVIHIISRRGRGPVRISMSGGGGSYGRREFSAGVQGGVGSGGYALSVGQVMADGTLPFNNQSRNLVISGSADANPDPETRVRFSGRYADRRYHFPTDGSGNVVDANAFTFGDEAALAAEFARRLTRRLEMTAELKTYTWDGGSDDAPDDTADTLGYFGFTSLDAFRRTSADLRLAVDLGAGASLSLGGEYEQERQRSFSESLSQYGSSTGESSFERSNRGIYGHLLSQGSSWSGHAGVRVESNEQYGTFLTYQAGASYTISRSGTRLRGTVGRGFKEPTFLETSATGYTVGNPELDPERSLAFEAGFDQSLGSGGTSLAATWFRQSLKDLIQYTYLSPEPGGPNFFNIAEARTQGVEASLEVPMGPALVRAGYTYLDTEVLDAGFDEGDGAVFVEGEPLIRRPTHQASLSTTLRSSRIDLSGSVRWVGDRSDRDFGAWPAQSVRLDSYVLVNAGLEVRLLENWAGNGAVSLRLSGENLLDSAFQEVFGFKAPGRSVLVGGRILMGGT